MIVVFIMAVRDRLILAFWFYTVSGCVVRIFGKQALNGVKIRQCVKHNRPVYQSSFSSITVRCCGNLCARWV